MVEKHLDLATRRTAARHDMEREVDLGLHSVPGVSLDSVGQREAEAYIDRVRQRWHEQDAELARETTGIDESLRANGCRIPE